MKYSLVRVSSSHMVRTAGEDDDPGEEEHGGVEAFDAHEVGDAEGLDPLILLDELQSPETLVIGHKDEDGQGQGDARRHHADGPDEELLLFLEGKEDEQPGNRGQQHTGQIRK